MLKRLVVLVLAGFVCALVAGKEPSDMRQYRSSFLRIELAGDQPAFTVLAVDSLGKNKLGVSALRPPAKLGTNYILKRNGRRFEYRAANAPADAPEPSWAFEFSERRMQLRSSYSGTNPPPALVLNFDANLNHATLLGHMISDGSIRLPALLHLPDQGTFRITSSAEKNLVLGYDAQRYDEYTLAGGQANDYIKVTFPAASIELTRVEYTLEVVAIYPPTPKLEGDPRFDGFRRNWLNIFQLNPRIRALANNAASDPNAFTLYECSSIAVPTPLLAPGLTALDLIQETLDRYLSGMESYGIAGFQGRTDVPYDTVDTYPSLLSAAWDYVRGSNNQAWLEKNYAGLKGWIIKLLAMDREGDGLFAYPASGNSGSWTEKLTLRPGVGFWDDIGFGHEDAYSNALAYHALLSMAEMARRAHQPADVELCESRARKLRSVYFDTFYNPATAVLAGWKSTDGKLHDYYFTFVNGTAITFGLVPQDRANHIMDRMLSKIREVGYTHFEYGLPGNLIPIRREDYLEHNSRWGGGEKADGSDFYQIWENGGASACYVYFTLQALYQLGRHEEADAILFPLLRGYEDGNFQGRSRNGLTNEWRAWDGSPHGYEGLLMDNYHALLAVLSR